jgi:shikimate dehydrogenase
MAIHILENLNGETRLYPIIGDPIAFVKIPPRLTCDFEARRHNGICIPMRVAGVDLELVIRALTCTPNVDGVLITMPHKTRVFSYCATTSERAKRLGVVSVIRRVSNGTWHGDVFDGLAFVKAQKDQGAKPEGARVLLVGAGGAGSAIAMALLEAGARELIIHDADETRAAKLVKLLARMGRGQPKVGAPDPTGCDMVCNATPMGMAAGDPLPVDANLLTSSMFVGDVITGHGVTPFLRAAQGAGCRTANGVQMVEAVREMMVDFLLGNRS